MADAVAELFPEAFVAGTRRLRLSVRRVAPQARRAEHTSRRAGAGMEFRDFRPYSPGDDLRRLDWNVYRRSGRLFLRTFDEPRALRVTVLLDRSTSMGFNGRTRFDAARQIAVAFTAAALNQHDRVVVCPFANGLTGRIPVPAGPLGLVRLMGELASLVPDGDTNLVQVTDQIARLRVPPGLLVVVSDFFMGGDVTPALEALGRLRHRVLPVVIARQSDRDPTTRGAARVIDCESGAAVDVTANDAVLARYRAAYDSFRDVLERFAQRQHLAPVEVDADRPVLDQLSRVFPVGLLNLN